MIRLIVWPLKALLVLTVLSILWVLLYAVVPPPITPTMLADANGATRDWVALSNLDRDIVRGAIAGEDGRFCVHNGFDFVAITNAMAANASGRRMRGGSTISQQTAKNAFLWQGSGTVSRSLRKAPEAWFTFLIENLWGKRRIMEVYLNIAETGIGTYGVEAGARRYFRKGAGNLSRSEAARIIAVFPLPKKRGAVSPRGFTRRYGNSIASRIGVVQREGLDACIY